MTGIGTPNNQSSIPRPIAKSSICVDDNTTQMKQRCSARMSVAALPVSGIRH